jgi:hypothetical protein
MKNKIWKKILKDIGLILAHGLIAAAAYRPARMAGYIRPTGPALGPVGLVGLCPRHNASARAHRPTLGRRCDDDR